jgi:hypothetical protein
MRKNFQSVKCTVLLTASDYISMLEAVDLVLTENHKNQSGPLIKIGTEFHDIVRVESSRFDLHKFIVNESLQATNTNNPDDQNSYDAIESILRGDHEVIEKYTFESDYYSIKILMSIYDGVLEKLNDEEWKALASDKWVPPENFAGGTDAEQEIWNSHHSKPV